ncbi:MAG: ABC transporter substrate-binding protein [Thermodesulfobacteriota bacterium]
MSGPPTVQRTGGAGWAAWLMLWLLVTPASLLAAAAEGQPAASGDTALHEKGGEIAIATQPLATPVGLLAEVMRRDCILARDLAELHLRVSFHPFANGPEISALVRQGTIDVSMAGDTPVLVLATQADIRVVALAKLGGASVVTWARHDRIQDLAGQRVGVPLGTTAHFGLLLGLAAAGMQADDITIVPMPVADLPRAMTQGQIEAFSAWEPTPTAFLAAHPDAAAIHRFLNASYLFFRRSLLQDRPEAATRIMASYLRALRWLGGQDRHLSQAAQWTQAAADAFSGRAGASVDQIAAVTRSDLLRFGSRPLIPQGDREPGGRLAKAFAFLRGQGLIAAGASWDRVAASLDTELATAVLADPDRYRLEAFDYTDGAELP